MANGQVPMLSTSYRINSKRRPTPATQRAPSTSIRPRDEGGIVAGQALRRISLVPCGGRGPMEWCSGTCCDAHPQAVRRASSTAAPVSGLDSGLAQFTRILSGLNSAARDLERVIPAPWEPMLIKLPRHGREHVVELFFAGFKGGPRGRGLATVWLRRPQVAARAVSLSKEACSASTAGTPLSLSARASSLVRISSARLTPASPPAQAPNSAARPIATA